MKTIKNNNYDDKQREEKRNKMKNRIDNRNRKFFTKRNSGYDIDSLMSAKDTSALKHKKQSSYFISKTTAIERRKRLGLI